MRPFKFVVLLLFICLAKTLKAQTCPDNIDYIKGDFTNWKCSTGSVDPEGVVSFDGFVPVYGRHTLNINTSTAVDPYGNFPVVAPNGSKYSLKLGNSGGNHEAEQVSYTYTIPADKPDYIFTYYYAVVLQLTAHKDYERPRFAVKLTDVTTNEVIPCGTHDFISGDGLGSFQRASGTDSVEFRDWSTVAVELGGKAGHTIKFDFTTNDCVYTKHFGYAYLAFDDPCLLNNEPITGTKYCNGVNSVTLKAPPGFDQYTWRQVGSNATLGGQQELVLNPVPPDGTQYTVDAESFSGVGAGCPATFTATVHKVDEPLIFKVKSLALACQTAGVDLTAPAITAGSGADVTFKYYADANQQVVVRDPTAVHASGTFYIKGTNAAGCQDLQSIQLSLVPDPVITITNPALICAPATVDLTDPAIVGGLNSGLIYKYYLDQAATQPVPNPKSVSLVGSYYIMVTNATGCSAVFPVKVDILPIPYIKPITINDCGPLNATLPVYHADDTNGLTYKYYKDAAATILLDDPKHITQNGTYYVVGINQLGCTTLSPVPFTVSLYPLTQLDIKNPVPLVFPLTIDLSSTYTSIAGYTYSFYSDSGATVLLSNYSAVAITGKYYIKAVNNSTGCQIIKAVTAVINPPDYAGLDAKNTFTPNGDGVNDEFKPKLIGAPKVNYLKIYSRNGSLVYETKDITQYWQGTMNGGPLPTGTYYWVFSCYDTFYKKDVIKSGSVTIIR